MKKLFIFSVISFICEISFSQTSVDNQRRADAMKDPKFIEFKKNHDDLLAKAGHQTTSSYYGYEEILKSYFIGDVIPNETPKADVAISKSEYVKTVNDWISKNKNLLKPENKNSLITE